MCSNKCWNDGCLAAAGAGKTSLIGCLFRLMELDEGHIFIDKLDAGTLGLHQLRSRMAIIPQVGKQQHDWHLKLTGCIRGSSTRLMLARRVCSSCTSKWQYLCGDFQP